MLEITDMPDVQPGEEFTLDLTSLAQEFMDTDEFEEYCAGGEFSVDGEDWELVFEENGDNFDNPYIDLHIAGGTAMDGETVEVVENDPVSKVMTLRDTDGEVDLEFSMDYGLLYSCLSR